MGIRVVPQLSSVLLERLVFLVTLFDRRVFGNLLLDVYGCREFDVDVTAFAASLIDLRIKIAINRCSRATHLCPD
jgi:hypothetical protein